jgi:hypothetical protein
MSYCFCFRRLEFRLPVRTAALLLTVALAAFSQAKSRHHASKKAAETAAPAEKPKPFDVVEATIPRMRAAMESGRVTSHELVMLYLARIGMYEDQLHAVMTVNPHALQEADERDAEWAQGRIRGPLHGIPMP